MRDIEIRKDCWQSFLCKFHKKNYLRPASLEICKGDKHHRPIDSLPFNRIGLQVKDKQPPTISLDFGCEGIDDWHLLHKINNVSEISIKVDERGNDKVLNFKTIDNKKAQLVFRNSKEAGHNS